MRSLPLASTIKDGITRLVVEPIQDALSILGRNKGKIEDSALLVQDLINMGHIRIQNGSIIYNANVVENPALKTNPVLGTSGSGGASISVSVTGSGATKTVNVAVDTGGLFVVRLWLTDTTDPSRPTAVPPTGGDKVDWMIVTASDGTYSEEITNSTVRDWYVNGMIVGKIDSGTLLSFT